MTAFRASAARRLIFLIAIILTCMRGVSAKRSSSRIQEDSPIKKTNAKGDLENTIDIVLLADPVYSIGIAAAINASRVHSTSPLRFWIGFEGSPSFLMQYLECVGVDSTGVTVRRPVKPIDISSMVVVGKERLISSSNFARFKIPKLFPELKTIWYFDVDVLPLSDLTETTRAFRSSGTAIRPVIRNGTIAKQYPDPTAIRAYYLDMVGRNLSLDAPSWNAGVFQADVRQWGDRDRDIAKYAAKWMKIKAAYSEVHNKPLWKLATQPLMYLLFHEDVNVNTQNSMPKSWNCESIDMTEDFGAERPPGCDLVHWNGAEKPWDPDARGHALWANYLPAFRREECQRMRPSPSNRPPSPSPKPSKTQKIPKIPKKVKNSTRYAMLLDSCGRPGGCNVSDTKSPQSPQEFLSAHMTLSLVAAAALLLCAWLVICLKSPFKVTPEAISTAPCGSSLVGESVQINPPRFFYRAYH